MTVLEEDLASLPSSKKLPLVPFGSGINGQSILQESLKRKGCFQYPTLHHKKLMLGDMLNGYKSSEHRGNGDAPHDAPVATLSNMGNTCFLNSVLYTLRFSPTFLHNLHHLIGDLALVGTRLSQNKGKTSSLGRNVGALTGPGSRSTSSKDLLSLGNGNSGTSASEQLPKSKVQIVTEKLHDLFVTMHNSEMKENGDAYQPTAFLQAVQEANSIFEGNHQQDAHELLVYLLDNIRETSDVLAVQVQQHPELVSAELIPQVSNHSSKIWNVRRSWKKVHKKKVIGEKNHLQQQQHQETISEEQHVNGGLGAGEDVATNGEGPLRKKKIGYNFVVEDFQGITLRRTTCAECESVSERKEPFYDIPVPVKESDFEAAAVASATSRDEEATLSEMYRKACMTSEKLCDSNKYLCETCHRYNEATRDVHFEKLPNIMVLQLKRFTTTSSGVQKVNTFLPTPLELACFCDTCLRATNHQEGPPPHRYSLCCVIMHLGASMASGHYIAYVKASDNAEDYADCTRTTSKVSGGSLSASSSEKSLNFLKYFRTIESASSKTIGILNGGGSMGGSLKKCKSLECCGVRLNKNVMENVINSYQKRGGCHDAMLMMTSKQTSEQLWLECDDENVRPISLEEFEEELSFKPNSTSTPYLLFYSKVTDVAGD